jgi:hypothetical protein
MRDGFQGPMNARHLRNSNRIDSAPLGEDENREWIQGGSLALATLAPAKIAHGNERVFGDGVEGEPLRRLTAEGKNLVPPNFECFFHGRLERKFSYQADSRKQGETIGIKEDIEGRRRGG